MAWFRKRQGKKLASGISGSSKSAPRLSSADLEVVGQLIKHGADMTQPRHVLYFSYFPSAEATMAAAEAAEQRLFEVQVNEPSPERPELWQLVCERKSTVLSGEVIKENSDFFTMVARQARGQYDGWEASIQPAEGD